MSFSSRDNTIDQAGSSVSRPYAVGGVDFGITETIVAGVAVGYADGKDKFDNGLGTSDVTSTEGMAYVSSINDRFIIQFVGGYSVNRGESSRNIPTLGRTAVSNHGGSGWSLAAKVAVPFHIDANTALGPYAVLGYPVRHRERLQRDRRQLR